MRWTQELTTLRRRNTCESWHEIRSNTCPTHRGKFALAGGRWVEDGEIPVQQTSVLLGESRICSRANRCRTRSCRNGNGQERRIGWPWAEASTKSVARSRRDAV